MTARRTNRIHSEMKEMENDPLPGVSAWPINENNLLKWEACINGPQGSPYEGGLFYLDVNIPKEYPMAPPFVKFRTKIYHMNIDMNGFICLDILHADHWSPALTISTLLLSISSLMADPNPDSPLDEPKANLWRSDRAKYEADARAWTANYAIATD